MSFIFLIGAIYFFQACYDRVVKKDKYLGNSTSFAEFISGIHCITEAAHNLPISTARKWNNVHKTFKEIRAKNTVIVPSDKTKRLVALDQTSYKRLVEQALNNDDKEVRSVLPSTRQQKFNSELMVIADKYKNTQIYSVLARCKASDPLPSKPYALPKDHKLGDLKGRPIISTCNSIIRPLSQWMAGILNPLVKQKVVAHLGSTQDFIESVKGHIISGKEFFGSLDVSNLYGSIPLEDDNANNTPGLISVVSSFFECNKDSSHASNLESDDFKRLLRMVLFGDIYFFDGVSRVQTTGIAMGNCAAPPLAIIYMSFVEERLISLVGNISVWKRYIDDIFFITSRDPDELLVIANSVNPHIKFTIEKPVNNTIPFLDTLVHVDNGIIQFELFIKPTHSGTCLPYDSHVPNSRKKCLIISENVRVKRIASNKFLQTSENKISNRLTQNGYPKRIINSTIRAISLTKREQPDYTSFIKIPFISEKQKTQVLKLRKRTNLEEKIRVVFTTEKPLAWQFRAKHEVLSCPPNCIACQTASKPGSCFTKNAIYRIECQICGAVYIGQTERTIRTRIGEHAKTSNSFVHQHMINAHGINNVTSFRWRIVTTHPYLNTRLAIEALHIQQNRLHLMNGCEGTKLLSFLQQ